MKKIALAAAMFASFSVFAEPILLPGGVSVPEPAVGNSTQGEGNVNNSFSFTQWFYVTNPDDETESQIVNLQDIAEGETYGSLFGSQNTTEVSFLDLVLTGVGELSISANPDPLSGDLSCSSCELTLTFDGLTLAALSGDQSALGLTSLDVYVSDLANNFNLAVFSDGFDNQQTFDDQYGFATEGTKWLTGTFSALNYRADDDTNAFTSLLSGDLDAAVDINPEGPGEGIANGNVVGDTLASPGDFGPVWFDAFAFSMESTFRDFDDNLNPFTATLARSNDANISANVVSTPATLGLFGLALMGMGLVRRNKRA